MENILSNNASNFAEPSPRRRAGDRAVDLAVEKMVLSDKNMLLESPEAMQKIVHQLQVHQIELEMQNEELRRTQFELETTRQRYFDLYDLAPVGYCTLSEHGLILEANLMAAKIFDASRGDLVNKPISSFIFKGDQDIYYLHRKHLIDTGKPQSYELRILNSNGKSIWVNINATCEKDPEGVALMRKVITDISERKQAEHTLRESEERYHREQYRLDQILKSSNIELGRATVMAEKASAVAEKANHAKSEFLSNMSHELRTPLGAILGFAQLIDSGTPGPTPTQKRNVDQILRAGWYLLDLINEILDLALIESGKLSMSMEPVALSQVLRDCQTMIEPQAEQHCIQVTFVDIKAPLVVQADRTRLKQVLINLMSNAIKYNKPNGTVEVSCTQTPEHVRIWVKDSGQGLAPEQIAQLFQPFNRLGQQNSEEQGTGIGLVMTKRLIELMGGQIGLESTLGEGSNFWVEIQLLTKTNATTADRKAATASTELQEAPHSTALHTLLYVEDNPANLMLVEDIIERRADIHLLTAEDGLSGINLARSAQPTLILMDINLPGMSGVSALKILQRDPLTAHIPVVALSANAIPADIQSGLDAGFFRYLTKPIKIDEFLSTLDTALIFAAQQSDPTIN
jgi:PAS domain S-box-containing protein